MWFDDLHQDLRYALRSFARSPIFVLTAVLSLAVGIGADTAIFTIANSLLLRPPAGVTAPERLVDISGIERDDRFGVNEISFLNFGDLRSRTTTLDDIYGYEPVSEPMSLAGTDAAERIFGHRVTTNYFAVLGVGSAAGRLFDTRASEQSAAEQTVVLSHRFWTRRFNRDQSIIGQTVSLNSSQFTIVGVAAPEFEGTSLIATDIWVPLITTSSLAQRDLGWALLRGRLKPGVSVAQSAAEVETIGRGLERQYPTENQGKGLRLATASLIPGNLSLPLTGIVTLVMGFVSLVLRIACSNLSGVLLARAMMRRREIAVRVAVGADRARLIRQLLTETIVLFALGGASGLLLARGLTSVIISLLPSLPVPIQLSLALDGRTIVFTTGVSFLAALVCGLVPALQTTKPDVTSTLKDEASGLSSSSRLRNAFVVSQVALSIVLVIAAGVFVRALQKATSIEPGFDPSGVEVASLDLSLANYTPATGPQFLTELASRIRDIPGVQDATVAASLPTGGPSRYGYLSHPGVQPSRGGQQLPADWNVVQPRYFSTMRIPFRAGRDFNDADRDGAQRVVIVSEEAGRRYWPGLDPIGKVLWHHPGEFRRGQDNVPRPVVVIGIVGDVETRLRETPRPQVYLTLQQQFVSGIVIAARTTDGQRLGGAIRHVVASLNRNLPILTSQALEEAVASTLLPQRLGAFLSGSLGAVGLLLAMMGLRGYRIRRDAARERDRNSHRSWRNASGNRRHGSALRRQTGSRWCYRGSAVRRSVECSAVKIILWVPADRPCPICCFGNTVHHRRLDGVLRSITASHEDRPVGCTSIRLVDPQNGAWTHSARAPGGQPRGEAGDDHQANDGSHPHERFVRVDLVQEVGHQAGRPPGRQQPT
jgi:predicted permease